MTRLQFRVLYREFLFRMVDLELLSAHAQGGMSKLFGQFAALLIFLSILFAMAGLGFGGEMLPAARLAAAWSGEHFLIATTMLVAGLFAVLSWDSTFPDRRDVLVLGPLPVRARTMFVAKVAAVAASLSLTVLLLHSITGLIWPLALNARVGAHAVPALTTDPAMAPVDAENFESVMRRDLEPALARGPLASGTGGGVVIGIVKHGARRVLAYGTAKPDSIFEIGSISKTFTGLMLARMAIERRVKLDEPVRELLPPGVLTRPAGREITLLDLATHHSGLPRLPTNLDLHGKPNPGANYHASDLYAYLARRSLARPDNARFLYSNLGFGLLGVALANRAGMTYPDLLKGEITMPLDMRDTAIVLSPEQQSRIIQAYDLRHRPIAPWDLDTLAGAGAIRSTAEDMLSYLEANLHPESVAAESLRRALALSHERRAKVASEIEVALAWIYNTDTGTWWHNGAISGYTSHAFSNPAGDYAAIVLVNQAAGPFAFSELLARHIRERLAGEPTVSFAQVTIPARGGFARLPRMFAAYWATMLAAGAFIFCCVLCAQGLAAQLMPRRWFLRASSWMQLGAFCVLVSVYFLQPLIPTPDAIIAAQGHGLLAWSPSYWFLGLLQQLNGSPALAPLAYRAWIGLAIGVCGTAAAYGLSYFRTLRRIVEEPDIAPGRRGIHWLPRFGKALPAAIVQFSVRALARSRQHRVILAFYLGIAFAITIFFLRSTAVQQQLFDAATDAGQQSSAPALAASIVIMGFWVVGTRVVFSMPLELPANWLLRVTPVSGGRSCLAARRRSLVMLSVVPAWTGSALLLLWLWPWRQAAGHLVLLALFGMVLAEACLHGPQKIPFTCSYLPGKSNFHLTFWLCIGLVMQVVNKAAELEQRALGAPVAYAVTLAMLGAVLALLRWRTAAEAVGSTLQFEETWAWQVQELGLAGAVPKSAARGPAQF